MEVATTEAVQPAIRFHGFSGEYRRTRLGECSSFISKGTTPKKFTPDGIRYLRSDCVGDGYVDPGPCLFIDERTHISELKRSQLQAGDVLFAIAGSIGKVGVVKEEHLPANTNQALAIIRLKDSVSRELIVQMLQSHVVFDYVRLNTSVGAQPNLSLEQVGNLAVSLPTLLEQQKIAAFLGAVDRKIQQLKRKQELLERYKKGVMELLLSRQIRFPGFKDEWRSLPLSSLGKWRGGSTPSKSNPAFWNGTIPWISSGDVKSLEIIETTYSITEGAIVESSVPLMPKDTLILVTRSGILRKYLPIAILPKEMAINQDIKAIVTNDKVDPRFLLFALINKEADIRKVCGKEGTTVESVDYPSMLKYEVELPSLEEQSRIAGFLMAFDAKVAGVAQAVAAAQQWKKGLLQQMFV